MPKLKTIPRPTPTQSKWNYTFIDEPIQKKKPRIESLFYKYDWNTEIMIAICKAEVGF